MADKKLIDEQHVISSKKGNGMLRREVSVSYTHLDVYKRQVIDTPYF